MIFALSVIIKTTIVLASVSLMSLSLRRVSASSKHTIWMIGLFAVLILPPASFLLPHFDLPVLPENSTPEVLRSAHTETAKPVTVPRQNLPPGSPGGNPTAPSGTVPATRLPAWSWHQWVALLWAIGSGTVLLRLLLGRRTVRRLAGSSRPVTDTEWLEHLRELQAALGVRRRVRVRIGDREVPPMTWGMRTHVILLPATAADWSIARRRLVLAHELAHIRRNDGVVQILVQAVCSIYWFNPLVWHAVRCLRIERECACDDQVLSLGVDADEYADHLLQVARTISSGQTLSLSTVAMAHRSQLETRLLSILDERTARQSLPRLTGAALLSAVATLTLCIAVVQVTAKPADIHLEGVSNGSRNDSGSIRSGAGFETDLRGAVFETGSNDPLEDALVTLTPLRQGDSLPEQYAVETDLSGQFHFNGLRDGQYRIGVALDGFVALHSAVEPALLTLDGDRAAAALTLHMLRGPAISGRILDDHGRARLGAHVELMHAGHAHLKPGMFKTDAATLADTHGEYHFGALPAGEYYLRARPQTGSSEFLPVYFPGVTDARYAVPIAVRDGADVSGIDLAVSKGARHTVRLAVEIAAPVPAAPDLSFYVNPISRSGVAASGSGMSFRSLGRNVYESPLLAPGSYEIEVYLRDPDPVRSARTTVVVDGSDVNAGTVIVRPGVSIPGRVGGSEGLPDVFERDPLYVVLRPSDGSVFVLPTARVAPDGTFLLQRVPERNFRVELTGVPPEAYLAGVRYGGRDMPHSIFKVSDGSGGPLELSIGISGGVVAGVVRNSNDQPVSNSHVLLIPASSDGSSIVQTASTDQFGVFSIAGVPPGEYGILALLNRPKAASLDAGFFRTVESQVTKVIVQRGFTNTINLRAIPEN